MIMHMMFWQLKLPDHLPAVSSGASTFPSASTLKSFTDAAQAPPIKSEDTNNAKNIFFTYTCGIVFHFSCCKYMKYKIKLQMFLQFFALFA